MQKHHHSTSRAATAIILSQFQLRDTRQHNQWAYTHSGLSAGNYTVYVRGMDIGKQWSATQSATLTVLPVRGYINGTVIDNSTKAGIPGAKVITDTSVMVQADGSGFYSMYLDAGTYNLTATSDPAYYANVSVSVTAISNETP